jgi:pimeloyl-ACP methyl ester carboxylesterase
MAEVFLHSIGASQPSTPNPDAQLDVVFIHGLNGDAIKTWAAGGDPANFWPRWLVKDVPSINVWSADYDASVLATLSTGGGVSLIGRAASLLDLLLSHGIGNRPVIFITHSLGGLLVKQLLRACADSVKPDCKKLLAAAKAVVFCGTPHQGAKLASSVNSILSLITSTQLKQLQENEEQLKDLHNWFINWVATSQPSVCAYRETIKTKGFWIVPEDTANPHIAGCDVVPIDADHIQLCKPTSHESPLYISVRALVTQTVKTCAVTDLPTLSGLALPGSQSHILVPGFVPVALSMSALDAREQALPPEIAIDFEHFTTVAADDRRSLSDKLNDAHRGIEIADAERAKERFAKSLYRNASQASSLGRYTRLMSDVETRFKRHVRPLIAAGKDETLVNGAVQTFVIMPALEKQLAETDDVSAAVVVSALYYLTGNCHVRWDEN